jgi:hypothetical protein
MNRAAPENPAGPFEPVECYDETTRDRLTQELQRAPENLQAAVRGLSDAQLDVLYRNWSARQIVHHLADSHLHSYIRFKWALTEDCPTIKAYDESDWARLPDARVGIIEPALALMSGLHQKWVQVLTAMPAEDFSRTFHHPESNKDISLWHALNYYAWHARHHTQQILWLRQEHHW